VCRSLDGAMRALEAAEKQYALYEGEVIDFE
jgi:hypothetical protein